MRVAFLTDEYVTAGGKVGGLGSYLHRICLALRALGNEPEVFVYGAGYGSVRVQEHDGIRVHHVPGNPTFLLRCVRYLDRRLLSSPWGGPSSYLIAARALARALEARHKENPFDIVQSANTSAAGLLVRRNKARMHAVRLSSLRALWFGADGVSGLGAWAMVQLERASIRRANLVYAPSEFLAEQCKQRLRSDVDVVRPPMFLETQPAANVPAEVPERYLVHFGQIGARKGSDVIASALIRVWREEPEFRMVWAGREIRQREFEDCHRLWGPHADKVVWLGAVEKPLLYAIVQKAVAAVVPSRVDNLPNTVIESLLLGVPVIGSAGASIDELVEPGVCGELAPIGDSEALARLMLKAWRGKASWVGAGFRRPLGMADFEPEAAARRLLDFMETRESEFQKKVRANTLGRP